MQQDRHWQALSAAQQTAFVQQAWAAHEFDMDEHEGSFYNPFNELCEAVFAHCDLKHQGAADATYAALLAVKHLRVGGAGPAITVSEPLEKAEAIIHTAQEIAARLITKHEAHALFDAPPGREATLVDADHALSASDFRKPGTRAAAEALHLSVTALKQLAGHGHGAVKDWKTIDRQTLAQHCQVLAQEPLLKPIAQQFVRALGLQNELAASNARGR